MVLVDKSTVERVCWLVLKARELLRGTVDLGMQASQDTDAHHTPPINHHTTAASNLPSLAASHPADKSSSSSSAKPFPPSLYLVSSSIRHVAHPSKQRTDHHSPTTAKLHISFVPYSGTGPAISTTVLPASDAGFVACCTPSCRASTFRPSLVPCS